MYNNNNNNIMRLLPSLKVGQSCLGHIYNFYQIDDKLSWSNDSIIESGSSMALHCTENLRSVSRVVSEPESFTLQSVTLTTWPSLRLKKFIQSIKFDGCSLLHIEIKFKRKWKLILIGQIFTDICFQEQSLKQQLVRKTLLLRYPLCLC